MLQSPICLMGKNRWYTESNKHMKRCSILFIIQGNAKQNHMTTFHPQNNQTVQILPRRWRSCNSYIAGENINGTAALEKSEVPKKLTHNPAIPFLSLHSREKKTQSHKNVYTNVQKYS